MLFGSLALLLSRPPVADKTRTTRNCSSILISVVSFWSVTACSDLQLSHESLIAAETTNNAIGSLEFHNRPVDSSISVQNGDPRLRANVLWHWKCSQNDTFRIGFPVMGNPFLFCRYPVGFALVSFSKQTNEHSVQFLECKSLFSTSVVSRFSCPFSSIGFR